MPPSVLIVPFRPEHQSGIDRFMAGVQAEFAEPMYSSASQSISEMYQLPGQQFWVALQGQTVIGTIGLVVIDAQHAVLKRMMLAKAFRGGETAPELLNTVIQYAKKNGIRILYLGTMQQMKAAHRFYEKQGFKRIEASELPPGCPLNPVDTVYYQLDLQPR